MIEKIINLYKKYTIPDEFSYESYKTTIERLKVIFGIMSIFCIFEVVLTCVSEQMQTELDSDMIAYYIVFGFAMIAGCCACVLWCKKQNGLKRHLIEAKIIISCAALFFLALLRYEAVAFNNLLNAIALYIILSICILFVLNTNPFIYSIIQLMMVTISIPDLYNAYGNVSMIINSYIFVAIMICISFILTKKEIHRFETEKKLIKYGQKMENKFLAEADKRIQIQNDVIYAMADLVESRDLDTGEHVKRTSFYAKSIALEARRLGYYEEEITDDFIDCLEKSMPLHDIGKIVIPDSILKAQRKLTEEEFEIMKTHTIEGEAIIENIFGKIEDEKYIKFACDIAKYHHEWWCGRGYPCGLKGETIPLSARIAAIADVFDALTSDRCYKKSYSIKEALKVMKAENGIHFDPKLFKAFLKIQDTFNDDIKKVSAAQTTQILEQSSKKFTFNKQLLTISNDQNPMSLS